MMQSVLDSMHDTDPPQPEASSSSGAQRNSSTPSSSSAEPPPVPTLGPDYYELRRQEWLRPATPSASAAAASNDAQSTTSSSSSGTVDKKKHKVENDSSRARLESLLSVPGAEEDDELWKAYLHTVHDGLVGGKRFKKGIKLAVAVKILKAGWLRDGTWDTAAAASMNPIPTTSTITAAGISASRGLRALLTGGRHQYRHTQHASITSSLPPPPSEPLESMWAETIPNTPTTARGQVTPPTSAGSSKSTFFNTTISRFLPAALVGKFVSSSSAGEKKRHGRQTRSESWPVVTKEPTANVAEEQGAGGEAVQNDDEEALVQDSGITAAPGPN